MILSEEQLSLVQRTHPILAQFTVNVNQTKNFDLNFDLGGKSTVAFYTTPPPTSSTILTALTSIGNSSSGSKFEPIDPFSQLQIDPQHTDLCCLFLIIKQPGESFVLPWIYRRGANFIIPNVLKIRS